MVNVILTAPATEMSNHHGKEFLGFGTCSPPQVLPPRFIKEFFYPKIKNKKGIVKEAPYGLRKIESVLIDEGLDVLTVHPYDLNKYLDEAKVLGVSVMDPLGFGPVSVTFTFLLGGTASTKIEFVKLMEKIKPYREKIKVIVGGAGAWQLEWDSYWKSQVDCIVIGEAEEIVADLFKAALKGEELPKVIKTKSVEVEKIPTIKNPSVNGLVEISRGCGRGCKFCSETLKKRRDIPLDKIIKEAKICIKGKTRRVILHAEDVLLYKCKSPRFIPNEKAVLNLFSQVRKIANNVSISHCSLAAVAAKPSLVEKINEILEIEDMFGVQVGLETGSSRIMEKYMRGKCLPFHPNEWHEVAEEAFLIMHENKWVPAATLIVGMPGETEEDVLKTIELVERLSEYRSMIVPLIFIPMEVCALKGKLKDIKLNPAHYELLALCMEHNIKWVEDIMKRYFKGLKNTAIKIGYWAFVKWIKKAWKKRRKEVLNLVSS